MLQKSCLSDGTVIEAMKWAGRVKRMNEGRQPRMAYSLQAYVKKAKFWVDSWQPCLKTPKKITD